MIKCVRELVGTHHFVLPTLHRHDCCPVNLHSVLGFPARRTEVQACRQALSPEVAVVARCVYVNLMISYSTFKGGIRYTSDPVANLA